MPSQPTNLQVKAIDSSWILLDWVQPIGIGLQGISYYTVTVMDSLGVRNARDVSTPDNTTMLNITNLFPTASYTLVVRAVSSVLGVKVRSQASNVITQMTGKIFVIYDRKRC